MGPYQQPLQEVRLNVSPGPDKTLSLCEDSPCGYELLLFGPNEQSRLLVAISITDQAQKSIWCSATSTSWLSSLYCCHPVRIRNIQHIFFIPVPDSRPCFPFGSRVRAATGGWVECGSSTWLLSCKWNALCDFFPMPGPQSNYAQAIKKFAA